MTNQENCSFLSLFYLYIFFSCILSHVRLCPCLRIDNNAICDAKHFWAFVPIWIFRKCIETRDAENSHFFFFCVDGGKKETPLTTQHARLPEWQERTMRCSTRVAVKTLDLAFKKHWFDDKSRKLVFFLFFFFRARCHMYTMPRWIFDIGLVENWQ